jgi:hypothetical protein
MKYKKDYPLRLLPNVKKMEITETGFDRVLGIFGVTKPLREFTFEHWFNGKHNRYLRKQYGRLLNNLNNPKKFWIIAEHLIKRSTVFRTVCIFHLLPT